GGAAATPRGTPPTLRRPRGFGLKDIVGAPPPLDPARCADDSPADPCAAAERSGARRALPFRERFARNQDYGAHPYRAHRADAVSPAFLPRPRIGADLDGPRPAPAAGIHLPFQVARRYRPGAGRAGAGAPSA